MRITFITHDIDSGGSARSLFILVQELIKRHTIQVITFLKPVEKKPIGLIYHELGVPLYFFKWSWLPVSFVGCPLFLNLIEDKKEDLLKIKELTEDTDIICFNSYAPSSLAPYFPEKPKVLIAREVIVESSPKYQESADMLKQHISMAIAIGPQESKQLKKMGIPHEIIFNTSIHQPYFHTSPTYPPIRFGMFAQFTKLKGIDILLQVCEEQASFFKKYNVHIHFFGIELSDEQGQVLYTIKDHDLEEHIHFEGWVHDVERSMISMHCMIRPDRTGSPWGRDIIEAMSLGRPILASGTEDVFVKNGKTGYLFPEGNSAILGKIINSIVKHPESIEKMGYNAFLFAKDNFSPFINIARIEQILQNTQASF